MYKPLLLINSGIKFPHEVFPERGAVWGTLRSFSSTPASNWLPVSRKMARKVNPYAVPCKCKLFDLRLRSLYLPNPLLLPKNLWSLNKCYFFHAGSQVRSWFGTIIFPQHHKCMFGVGDVGVMCPRKYLKRDDLPSIVYSQHIWSLFVTSVFWFILSSMNPPGQWWGRIHYGVELWLKQVKKIWLKRSPINSIAPNSSTFRSFWYQTSLLDWWPLEKAQFQFWSILGSGALCNGKTTLVFLQKGNSFKTQTNGAINATNLVEITHKTA